MAKKTTKTTKTGPTRDRKAAPKHAKKIEIWREAVGSDEVTVVRAGGVTTRIVRKTLHQGIQDIIRDPAARAHLEENPAEAMESMGIQMDDREKLALKGKRLSEILARLASSDDARIRLGFFPEAIVDVATRAVAQVTSSPEANAEVVSAATTESAGEVAASALVETGAEETVAVAVIAL